MTVELLVSVYQTGGLFSTICFHIGRGQQVSFLQDVCPREVWREKSGRVGGGDANGASKSWPKHNVVDTLRWITHIESFRQGYVCLDTAFPPDASLSDANVQHYLYHSGALEHPLPPLELGL